MSLTSEARASPARASFEQDERACGHREAEPERQTRRAGGDGTVTRREPFARRDRAQNRELERRRRDQQEHLELKRAVRGRFGRSRRKQQRAGRDADRKADEDRSVRGRDDVAERAPLQQRTERAQIGDEGGPDDER